MSKEKNGDSTIFWLWVIFVVFSIIAGGTGRDGLAVALAITAASLVYMDAH